MYQFKDEINYTNFFKFDNSLVQNKIWAKLPKASRSVYPVLVVHCNKNGICFPSQETIAILSDITPKTVREGIKGLNDIPGFEYSKYLTPRGHWNNKYKVASTPDKKGRSFPLFKCVFEGGNWSQLTSCSHSLYIVLSVFSFFDPELYSELEELEEGFYDFDALIKNGTYQARCYDFVNADLDIMAEYAGISRSATYGALDKLEKSHLIDSTENIDGYDTWKIYRIPLKFYERSCLNEKIRKRYGKPN